jgi:nitrous oxide reductase accessory protein NosL
MLPLVLVGCGGKGASADDPPDIKLGRDSCDRCGMIISEERFASGIVDENGDALIFDDVGEMVATIQEEGLNKRRAWVHGHPSLEWMDARDAWYAVTMEIPTPMGSGVFPFDNEAEVQAYAADQNGMVYTWEELLANWTFDAMM